MLKKKEIAIILGMLAASVIIIAILHFTAGGSKAVVYCDGVEYGKYDLNKNQTVEINTEYGINVFEISNGSVNMVSADCPDKLCVNMIPISEDLPGVIVCLPHKIVIEIRND